MPENQRPQSEDEVDPKEAKTADQEKSTSDAKWVEILAAWKSDPRSIPRVKGSQWYGPKYSHCLADYPGDPSAWVSSPQQAEEVAKKKGLIGPNTTVETRT